jgi:hypothetical protein
MGRNFQTILDECLRELETGQSLDAILARYPEEADELRPLLLTAQNLKAMPIARPRSHVQQAGWQRFLGQAIALRRARQRRPALSLWRPLAAAASFVLMLFLAGGATTYAASRSLPDSPLYPLKLATEEARLWFVFDEGDRAGILLDQTETRMSEISKLMEQGKPVEGNVLSAMRGRMTRATNILDKSDAPQELVTRADELSARQEEMLIVIGQNVPADDRDEYGKVLVVVHETRLELQGLSSEQALNLEPLDLAQGLGSFTGLVEQQQDGSWIISGTKILVDEATIVEGNTGEVVGQVAQVTTIRGPDAPRALDISLRGSEDLAKMATISGVIDSVQGDTIQVGGRTVLLGQHILLDGQLRQGTKVEVVGEAGEGQTFEATLIHVTPTEDGQDAFVYEGTLEQATASQWQVSGRTFELDPSTYIDAGTLLIHPGVNARVEGVCRGSDLVAKRIVLLAPEGPPETVTVEGVFQGQADGAWLIGGIPIDFAPESPALLTPPTGTLVKVSGSQKGQAIVVTTAESTRPPEDLGLVKLEGVVSQLDNNQWQIGPAPFRSSAVTRVTGQLIPGARAIVWALPSEDGSLDAIYIDVLDTRSLLAPPTL